MRVQYIFLLLLLTVNIFREIYNAQSSWSVLERVPKRVVILSTYIQPLGNNFEVHYLPRKKNLKNLR